MAAQDSTPKPQAGRAPTRRSLLLAAACGLVLAGCQVRPLYAPAVATAPDIPADGVAAELAAIAIDAPRDRTTQLVRNELAFGLGTGGTPEAAAYRLDLRAVDSARSLQLTGSGAALGRSIAVTADYRLVRVSDGAVVARNTVTAAASYTAVDQRFANQRAAIDATERAAVEVARIILAQLGTALAR